MENVITAKEPLAFSPETLAKSLGISKPTVYDLLHTEGFPALRVGKRWIIPCRAVELKKA